MRKLSWYFNRAFLTSPIEVGYRLKELLRKKYEKVFIKDFYPDVSLSNKYTRWYFDIDENKNIISSLENRQWSECLAKDLLEHKFSFFSFDKKFLGNIINWHRDHKNYKEAPLGFCKDIDYQDFNKVGDFKYIWEINRHQHLISIAKAYFITGRADYREEVRRQIMDWIKKNPFMKSINWTSSLELEIRLIS